MEVRLFTLFSRLAQAENWTKTKDFHLSCNLTFLCLPLNSLQFFKLKKRLTSIKRREGRGCLESRIIKYNVNMIYLLTTKIRTFI